jgi:hypothetical protein
VCGMYAWREAGAMKKCCVWSDAGAMGIWLRTAGRWRDGEMAVHGRM